MAENGRQHVCYLFPHFGKSRQTTTPPAGTPRRDYARENRLAIRDLEDDVRHQKAFTDEMRRMDEAKTKWKMTKFQDIKGKVTSIMVRRKKEEGGGEETRKGLGVHPAKMSHTIYLHIFFNPRMSPATLRRCPLLSQQ